MENNQIVELYKEGASLRKLCKDLKISKERLVRILKENNMEIRAFNDKDYYKDRKIKNPRSKDSYYVRVFTKEEQDNVLNLYNSGLSIIQTSKNSGLSKKAVRKILVMNNVKLTRRVLISDELRQQKRKTMQERNKVNEVNFTESQLKEIKKLYSEGKDLKELSLIFNCSTPTMNRKLKSLGIETNNSIRRKLYYKIGKVKIWNKNVKGLHLSPNTEFKMNDVRISGKNNNNWKGGITPLNHQLRTSAKYKIWRQLVFIKDNFTCQNTNCKFCHNVRGGFLHAHHEKAWSLYPELRFDVNNGITYCKLFHESSELHKGITKSKMKGGSENGSI